MMAELGLTLARGTARMGGEDPRAYASVSHSLAVSTQARRLTALNLSPPL